MPDKIEKERISEKGHLNVLRIKNIERCHGGVSGRGTPLVNYFINFE